MTFIWIHRTFPAHGLHNTSRFKLKFSPKSFLNKRQNAALNISQIMINSTMIGWDVACLVVRQGLHFISPFLVVSGTRESAFTYAISSAGVVYSIARACVTGDLRSCACSRERRPKELDLRSRHNPKTMYEWGGCGDNIEHGTGFAKRFIDDGENLSSQDKDKAMVLMNLHNNGAGREVSHLTN